MSLYGRVFLKLNRHILHWTRCPVNWSVTCFCYCKRTAENKLQRLRVWLILTYLVVSHTTLTYASKLKLKWYLKLEKHWLYFCLYQFFCKQDNSKSCRRMFTNFAGLRCVTSNRQLDFGDKWDLDPKIQEFLKGMFITAEYTGNFCKNFTRSIASAEICVLWMLLVTDWKPGQI